MTRLFLFFFPLTLFAGQPSIYENVNPQTMLEAIRLVENTSGWGRHSEYGPYQMIASVRATVGGHDKAAAMRWLKIVCKDLKRLGADVTPHAIALSWNAGVYRATRGRAPLSSYDYANRVISTYNSLLVAHPTIRTSTPIFSLTIRRFMIPCTP